LKKFLEEVGVSRQAEYLLVAKVLLLQVTKPIMYSRTFRQSKYYDDHLNSLKQLTNNHSALGFVLGEALGCRF